ncbi:thioredoxin family protein [Phenylobacterium sp.]|uniref:DUF1223 domain-containing protein n=1 Tax=Phenylobacterium sp. TaxID=1871053 RepID=UPI002736D089|nr:DUF1223 domain-containing protein [Phenylobacterium sp.]MDP3658666.1 DUF1223 domain-containing protein [Phenylobacterium sp.]
MRRAAIFLLLLGVSPAAAWARPPVVVELYTAQGCASCAAANAYVGKLAEKPGVLPLTFSVDYWDYLGWPDSFARPEFALRQQAYVKRLDLREPYTPQVVIDGRVQAGGQQTERIDKLLREAASAPLHSPDMRFIGRARVDVGQGRAPRGGGEVWLIRYDRREQDVEVTKGDSRGQTVPHRNVVRQAVRLGAWRGRPTAYRLPKSPQKDLASVVLLQAGEGGAILGVLEAKP